MFDSRRGLRLALMLIIVCLVPVFASAQTVTLAWDPSGDVAGYVVRWGNVQGVYPNSRDVGNVTMADITGLTVGGDYVVVIEAYDDEGNFSEPSTPLHFEAPGCEFAIDVTTAGISEGAGSGRLTVATEPLCRWTAVSQTGFITFDRPGGRGPGTVDWFATENLSSNPRGGTATIAGVPFTVNQAAGTVDAAARDRENRRADFDGDGRSDLLLQDLTTGNLRRWAMNGHVILNSSLLSHRVADNRWRIAGTGDFNGDGNPDIVWHHQTQGWVFLWYMNGATRIGMTYFSRDRVNPGWRIAAIGDINGDAMPDIVWQHNGEGRIAFWLMDDITVTGVVEMPIELVDRRWRIAALADFNGDGKNDIILRHTGYGEVGVWYMNGVQRISYTALWPGGVLNQDWQIAAVIDTDADNTPDLVWQNHRDGQVAVWYMNGRVRMSSASVAISLQPSWKIAGPK